MMQEIAKKEFIKALRMLNSLNCKYCVIDPDGDTHGDLQILPPKKEFKYPRGLLTSIVKPHLLTLQEKQIKLIPYGEFEPKDIQSIASTVGCELYGAGIVTTHMTSMGLEVFRRVPLQEEKEKLL